MKCTRCQNDMESASAIRGGSGMKEERLCTPCTDAVMKQAMTLRIPTRMNVISGHLRSALRLLEEQRREYPKDDHIREAIHDIADVIWDLEIPGSTEDKQ